MISHLHHCSFAEIGSKKRAFGNLLVIFGVFTLLFCAQLQSGENSGESNVISILPKVVTQETFAALTSQSPFQRSMGLSKSIVVTGVAHLEDGVFASLFDLETRESYFVGKEANPEGWQLVSIRGDQSELASLTAQIKVGGSEVVSIRYEKLPASAFKKSSIHKDGKSSGGGTGPHGGSDPRVLTPDQMADAKKGAANYREGFQADGYPEKPPAATVAKLSKLSVQQREALNVKMFEYRNRGLGLPERQKIYETLLDKTLNTR